MEKLLQQILSEIQTMHDDIAGIKEDIVGIKEDIVGIKEEQKNFRNEQQAVKLEMREGFVSVNKRIDRLESRIESEVIEKIKSLYDAREVLNDNLNDFRDEFKSTMDELIVRDFDKTVKLNKIEKIINIKNVK
ncbi:MAG: hypothetical protein PWQ67_2104 [Clostridia bacterium]|nr:hypothetical protein [Clostridia bacterium]